MRKLIAAMVVASAVAGIGAMPVFAEEGQVKQEKRERQRQDKPKKERDFTPVKGEITAVDGNKITVGEQSFTITDATEIVSAGQPYKETLKVGQKIAAKVKEGKALRIEVVVKKHEGDRPKKDGEGRKKDGDQPKKEQRD